MLPGFRFLFAAILLSMSVLVFGLGAAALLRAAHEQFASNPSWHATPDTKFAQRGDATRPVLAMLHIEPPPAAPKAPDNVPAVPAASSAAEPAATLAEPVASVAAPAGPEKVAALTLDDSPPPETAKAAFPASETTVQNNAAPALADAIVAAVAAETSARADEAEMAAIAPIPPPPSVVSPATSQTAAALSDSSPASPAAEPVSTKVATLGGPAVIVETPPPAKAASANPDRGAIKKRLQARRAAQRRKIAARAQLAARQPPQPATDPFAQPTIQATIQPTITVRKR